jgi:hypothetical protein
LKSDGTQLIKPTNSEIKTIAIMTFILRGRMNCDEVLIGSAGFYWTKII